MSISDLLDDPDAEDSGPLAELDPVGDRDLISDLRSVAHHEAGHAVIGAHFCGSADASIDWVTYEHAQGHTFHGGEGIVYYGATMPREEKRLASLAGAVAQLRHLGQPRTMCAVLERMSISDTRDAGSDFMPHHIAEVERLLDQFNGSVQSVVERLLERGATTVGRPTYSKEIA